MDQLIKATDILQKIHRARTGEEIIDEGSIESTVKKMFVSLAKRLGFGKKTPYWSDPGFFDFEEYELKTDQEGLPVLAGSQSLEGNFYGWALFSIRKEKLPAIPILDPEISRYRGGVIEEPSRPKEDPKNVRYYIALARYLPGDLEGKKEMWFLYNGPGPKDITDSFNEYIEKEECKSELSELIKRVRSQGIPDLRLRTSWKRMVVDRYDWEPFDPNPQKKISKDVDMIAQLKFDINKESAPFDRGVILAPYGGKDWAWELTAVSMTILGVIGYRIVLNQGVVHGWDYKVSTRSRYLYRGDYRYEYSQLSANKRYNDYFDKKETKEVVKELIRIFLLRGLDGINFPKDWMNVDQDTSAFSGD
jgi:hypothetical protein